MRPIERIRILLDAFDATKVADATGLHRATIRRVQKGENCSLDTLQKINKFIDDWKSRKK